MSRIKILVAAATAVLALLAVTTTASAFVPVQPLPTCTVGPTTVNCTGNLIGLPPGITHVELTVSYVCVYVFHREVVASHGTASQGADVVSDGHGDASYNLTVNAPTCPSGTVAVPQSATIALSQGGIVSVLIGPIPL